MSSRARSRLLSKRYELQDNIGTGGMAEVFLGRDRVLGRTVAVKTLLTQFASDPSFIARFRREAQSAAALNHPNIVGVYDTGDDNGTHYIVMEYIEGKTLRDVIREEGPLLPERAAEIAADVCSALAFAHSRGIVHRDVKPGNIMLSTDGAVKVTDFGIARAMSGDTVTQTATVLGTAQYFSPEQAQGSAVDARSDVYSLGVVLYEMLTRQVPFTGSSPVAIAYKHVKEDPIPPSRLNADVPPALEAIVMKAMAKNPANRYATAQEMREDLLRALQGRPVTATPVLSDATAVVSPLADETVVISRSRATTPRRVEPSPEQQRRRTGFLLLGLITLAIIGIAIWALAGAVNKPELLRVPSVVQLPQAEAQQTLRDRGFVVVVEQPIPSDEFEKGIIARQEPEAGTELEEGGTVRIFPSDGPQLVAVPNVIGRSRGTAEETIEKAGLKVGDVTTRPDSRVARGRIIDQDPSGGLVRAGTRVDLVVSSGKPTAFVPNVVGKTEQDARDIIEARGLKVAVEYEPQTFGGCEVPAGRVCRQSPEPETEVEEGSTVTIVVAQEPTEPTEPAPTEVPTGPPGAPPPGSPEPEQSPDA